MSRKALDQQAARFANRPWGVSTGRQPTGRQRGVEETTQGPLDVE